MKLEEFQKIMDDDTIETIFPKNKDNALMGLKIIEKYLPESGIEGAGHDIIYSVDVDKLIEAGITEEDAKKLKEINWMIQDDYLACYI